MPAQTGPTLIVWCRIQAAPLRAWLQRARHWRETPREAWIDESFGENTARKPVKPVLDVGISSTVSLNRAMDCPVRMPQVSLPVSALDCPAFMSREAVLHVSSVMLSLWFFPFRNLLLGDSVSWSSVLSFAAASHRRCTFRAGALESVEA